MVSEVPLIEDIVTVVGVGFLFVASDSEGR